MYNKQIKVLLIENNSGDFQLLRESLNGAKNVTFEIEWADCLSKGLKKLETDSFDVILLDLSLPENQGLATFTKVRNKTLKIPIIVMTGFNDENLAIKTVKEGAQDCLVKGQLDNKSLLRSILFAIERKGSETKLGEMYEQIEKNRDDLLSVLNQLRLGVAMTDEDGCITFLSNTCRHLLGREQDKVIGLPWSGVLFSEEETRDSLKTMLMSPREKRKKIPFYRIAEDGQQYWMEIDVEEDPRDRRRKIFFIYDVSEVHYLRKQLDGNMLFYDLIGKSKSMRLIYQQIQDLSTVDSTVIIEGDTGTGKELVARAIHFSGHRKMNPFVTVNCAGITEALVESQLYGHRRGAFTGAVNDQVGLFEAADGGTLFLDEVGDIPLGLQTNFLRAIQEKEILRVGEFKAIPVNVRIIAATHQDLNALVANGKFRPDLFYRLNVARIHLPLLRERREDIPLLVKSFLKQFQSTIDRSVENITGKAMRKLMEYHWPGNVRELRSAIEFAVIHSKKPEIQPEDLPPEVLEPILHKEMSWNNYQDSKTRLLAALEKAGGNRKKAAQILGIGRATFYRRLEKLGIYPEV